jgi:FkbM family methyltransferase
MSLASTLRFILSHPLNANAKADALRRFVTWQIQSRISSEPRVVPFVNGANLTIRRGRPASTANLYTGLHEFAEMGFVLHALREGDLFVDVGANIGAYSILAASLSGVRCVAFEPTLDTYELLLENIFLNRYQSRITAHRTAVGEREGKISVTSSLDTVNHIAGDADSEAQREDVPLTTLDAVLEGQCPSVIKVDVEGYETPVINGARVTLECPGLFALIIEMNGSGSRYGYDETRLDRSLTDKGFEALSYDPLRRLLIPLVDSDPSGNRIYVRGRDAVERRLAEAPQFTLRGGLRI